jgi:hypothetical protein
MALYLQQVELEYDPLEAALTSHKSEWLQLLDQCYDMPLFIKGRGIGEQVGSRGLSKACGSTASCS